MCECLFHRQIVEIMVSGEQAKIFKNSDSSRLIRDCFRSLLEQFHCLQYSPIVGAKFEIVFRSDFFRKTDCRSFFNDDARTKVVVAQTNDKRPLVNVDRGDVNVPEISVTASTTKIVLIKTENISSVNLVKYFTKLDPDDTDDTNKINDVHIPVHA